MIGIAPTNSPPIVMKTRTCLSRMSPGSLLLALWLTSPLWAADEPVALKAKWPNGRRTVHRITAVTDQKLTLPTSPQPIQQTITQTIEYRVAAGADLPAGGQELGLEVARLQLVSAMGAQTVMSFDSSKPASEDGSNPVAGMLRPLVGAKLKVLTTPSGKLDKVEGYADVRSKMMASAPPMVAGMMEGMFGENLVEQLGILPAFLPTKPVKVEDEWPLRTEMPGGPIGTITMNGTTRLARWEKRQDRDCAVLEGKGRLWSQPKAGAASIGSVSGEFTTTTWFDPKEGLAVESVSMQTLTAKLKLMGQEMTVPSTQKATNLLVNLEPPAKQ